MKTPPKKLIIISTNLELIEKYVLNAPRNLINMLYNANYGCYEANVERVKSFVMYFTEYQKILEAHAKKGTETNVNIFALRQRIYKGLEFSNVYLDALKTYSKDTVIDAERDHPVFLPTEVSGYIFWDKPKKPEIDILEQVKLTEMAS